MSKTVKTRVQNKIDTSTNWNKATNFVPLKGEIIIYSDLKKIKIGDGTTKVTSLPFINAEVAAKLGSTTVGSTTHPIYLDNGTAVVASNVNKEAYLTWGGRNLSGSYAPIDAAMIPELGANRFAFIPANNWTVEYSRDGGVTWIDYEADSSDKLKLTTTGTSFIIGKNTTSGVDVSNYMLRITLLTTGVVYTQLNKFATYISSLGSSGCYCTIEGRTKANLDAGNDVWVTFVNQTPISGWDGWNIINMSSINTHGYNSSQYANLRFIFGCTTHNSTYKGLTIQKIFAYGGAGWITCSNLARSGIIYNYDYNQNVTFPASVYANKMYINNKAVLTTDDKVEGFYYSEI